MKKSFALATLLASLSLAAAAQEFPTKPITLVVPFAAGGPSDVIARQLAEAMRKPLNGATIVIDNAGGAGGTIGAAKVARATPDGYTLLLTQNGMATAPALYRKLSYKPLEDFEYLGMVNDQPMVMLGSPKLPANTYRDFENYIRANTGKINMGHAGLGSSSHLCGLMWQSAIKLKEAVTTIAYRGTGPAIKDLMGGQIDIMCDQSSNATPQIEGGTVKAFAVTTAKPVSSHKILKDYPTLQEMGLKNFDLTIWHGLYAPKGTPPAIVRKLNEALKAALKDPDFIKRQEALGAYVVTDRRVDPEVHKEFVARETTAVRSVIEAAGQFAD